VAILIWIMIYPMMLKVDFASIKNAGRKPKGLAITLVVNWLIKPFTMYLIAWFFLKVVFKALIPEGLANEYLAGPFSWRGPLHGHGLRLVQPLRRRSRLHGGPGGHQRPGHSPGLHAHRGPPLGLERCDDSLGHLLLSVVLFVVIPLGFGALTRSRLVQSRGREWFEASFIPRFEGITEAGLLLTLIILFAFQGKTILDNPLAILLIAVPLILQTYLIFAIGYGWARVWKVPYAVAAPAGMIGASNFFELSVAVAISLFGMKSGAALATVVGVLVEVPVMLSLVSIAKRTRRAFPK
jgi:ACR3 family arsenite transporter